MCIISMSGTLFCNNSLTCLSSFISCLLVPSSCNHLSINHYLLLLSFTSDNAGVFFSPQLRTFHHQLYCVTPRVCDRKVKRNRHLQKITLCLHKAGGKDKNDQFTMMTWSTLSVILLFLKSTLSDSNIAVLAFLCYCLHSVSVPFLLLPTYLCPNISSASLGIVYSYLSFLPSHLCIFAKKKHEEDLCMCSLMFYFFLQ